MNQIKAITPLQKVVQLLCRRGNNLNRDFIRDQLVKQSSGVVHVGASTGQEIPYYRALGTPVLWVEAIPDVESFLRAKIEEEPNMDSVQALLWKRAGVKQRFNLANNNFHSSSIYGLAKNHGFKNLRMIGEIELTTTTLDTVLESKRLLSKGAYFSHLVLDVQGAELDVLHGAQQSLKYVSSLQVEVSNYPVYNGGALLHQIDSFMESKGFVLISNIGEKFHGDAIYVRTKFLGPKS